MRRFFACVLLLSAFLCGAEETGAALSRSVFEALENAGLTPEKQYLSEALSDSFPYNALVTILPHTAPSSETAAIESPAITTLALIISQEDAAVHLDDWLDFLAVLKSSSLRTKSQIVFTATDFSPLPPEYRRGMPAGARRYMESLEEREKTCALALCPGESGPYALPGSRSSAPVRAPFLSPFRSGISAPLWLTEQLPFPVYGSTLTLYRLNLMAAESRLTLFRANEIPSAAVVWNPANLAENTALFVGLRQFVVSFKAGDANDVNYSAFLSGLGTIMAGESVSILLYSLAAGVCLLYLCFFSLFGARSKTHIPVRKSWFVLPVLIALTSAALLCGQALSGSLFPDSAAGLLLSLGVKIIFVFFLFSLLNGAASFRVPLPTGIFSVLLMLQSVLNVLVFGAMDTEVLLLFFLEFAVTACLLRTTRRNITAGVTALILGLFYVPIVRQIVIYGESGQIEAFVRGGISQNTALSFFIIPFLLIWFRIQSQFYLYLRQKRLRRRFIALWSLALVIIVGGILLGISFVFSNTLTLRQPRQSAGAVFLTFDPSPEGISMEAQTTGYFDLEIVRLTVRADLPILRCDISLAPLEGSARFSTNAASAVVSENGAIELRLPEYPPNPLELSYTAARNLPTKIHGVFFLRGSGSSIIRKETVILLHD
jgi:hypothetical protein